MQQNQERRHGQIGDYWLSRAPKSPNWHRTWYDRNARQTRRVSLSTGDYHEAYRLLHEWCLTRKPIRGQDPANVTLALILAKDLEEYSGSLPSAKTIGNSFLKWLDHFDSTVIGDLDRATVNTFVGSLRDAGHSNDYINRILADGNAALNRAVKAGYITSAYTHKLLPKSPPRERILTNEEIGLLFDTVEAEHTFLYMMIAFTTGARPGAILDLTRERVDIDGGTINLLPAGQVQNKKRRPVVPICNTLRPWLILAGQTYVIEYQGQRVDNNRQAITRLAARAGLKGVSRYTIRHTVATELRERGLSDWDIATLLGHQDPNRRTTEGYAKSRDRTRSRIAAAIDAWFSEIQQHTKRPLILDPATAAQEIQALRGNCVGKLAA